MDEARRGAVRLLSERPDHERDGLLASLFLGALPTSEEIDSAMAGNICRCGTCAHIRAAIADAASTLV